MQYSPHTPCDLPNLSSGVCGEEQFRLLFEQAPVAMHEIDRSGVIVRVNQTECQLLGFAREQLLGRPVWSLVDEAQQEKSRLAVIAKLNSSAPLSVFRRQYRSAQGAVVHVEVHENRVYNSLGEPVGIRSALVDVTENERLAARLAESEHRFRTVVERLGEGICIVDTQELVTFANPAAERIFGVESGQLLGRSLLDFIPPTKRKLVARQSELRVKGQTSTYELEIIRSSGETRTLLVTGSPQAGSRGERIGTFGILRDITERKQAEHRLAASEQRFRRLASSMRDALVLSGPDGTITFWNRAAEHIFGFSRDEALGKNFADLLVPRRYRDEYRRKFRMFESDGVAPVQSETAELIAWHKSGRPILAELSFSHFEVDHVWQGLACIRDISRRKEAERQLARTAKRLEEARAHAEAASRAKSDFLASMSHEIRTPMNGVIGMTGLLLDSRLDEEQRFFAEAVRSSGESLLGLINEILDFSKIEARQVQLESLTFDLRTAMEDTLDLIAPKAAEKGLEAVLWFSPQCPRFVISDPGRLRQMVLNLLSNAVKFTEEGHVLLWVDCTSRDQDHVQLQVEVRDTGIGIAPDKIPELFERFTQADSSTTRRYGGTGLGLAIVKQLAELMGGEATARSSPGDGSTFRLTIPLKVAHQNPAVAPLMNIAGKRALVVDDNGLGRFITRELCLQKGMLAKEVSSGAQALGTLKQAAGTTEPFDVVLIDYMMPGMDGEELLSRIRSSPEVSGIAAVILTSVGINGRLEMLSALGCDAFLVKPVKAGVLESAIARALASRSMGVQSATLTPEALAAGQAAPSQSGRLQNLRARVLLVEDHAINQKLGVRLLERLGCSVDVVSNGLEAVEISASIPYDAIFMDCQMPVMDGYEATRRIRAREGTRERTPIVAMTAAAMREDQRQCRDAGMDEFISKPVSPDAIRDCLHRLLGIAGRPLH